MFRSSGRLLVDLQNIGSPRYSAFSCRARSGNLSPPPFSGYWRIIPSLESANIFLWKGPWLREFLPLLLCDLCSALILSTLPLLSSWMCAGMTCDAFDLRGLVRRDWPDSSMACAIVTLLESEYMSNSVGSVGVSSSSLTLSEEVVVRLRAKVRRSS
jgi:hypothetical protein